MAIRFRNYAADDEERVTLLARAAFGEHDRAQLIVAEDDQGGIVGLVAYTAPGVPKEEWFSAEWAVVHMLWVAPESLQIGVAEGLVTECRRITREHHGRTIAMATTPRMEVAARLYERLGFHRSGEVFDPNGVAFGIWIRILE